VTLIRFLPAGGKSTRVPFADPAAIGSLLVAATLLSDVKKPLNLYLCGLMLWASFEALSDEGTTPVFEVRPIGWVRKTDGRITIELDRQYEPALLGVEDLQSIWVVYWFDRNDSPKQRRILQVHPRGDPRNPLRGVFATRAPVRPNLIALSRCRVLSVHENVIEIDDIDAFPNTPVLDIKP
jgi:tRNA-Thr(GGU) m(6)t(6)A37 methyltransferase TsaA